MFIVDILENINKQKEENKLSAFLMCLLLDTDTHAHSDMLTHTDMHTQTYTHRHAPANMDLYVYY